MQRSTDRILTTHTGSLPRPAELVTLLYAAEAGDVGDQAAFETRIAEAVSTSVAEQRRAGVDIVNDGEMGKVSYSTYPTTRLTGYESSTHVPRRPRPDSHDFPEWDAETVTKRGASRVQRLACTGPVRYVGQAAVQRDIGNLKVAVQRSSAMEAFMTAASPGVIAVFQPNQYYPSNEAYLMALADAMREEYEAIHSAGFVLQLDCPDFTGLSAAETPGVAPLDLPLRVEALNRAVANIPADRMRLHLCWGNYEGPHHTDVPLAAILNEVLKAKPMGISFEGANPRHEHEWTVFERIVLPPDKVIVPGVLDSTTNYVEHPELVAQRITRYAQMVGPERIIAGVDCGFGTFAGTPTVHPRIVFAKLRAMSDGAQLASQQLF